MNYVFPKEARGELSIAIANKLIQYLREGNNDFGIIGLDTAPVFVMKVGTGARNDAGSTTVAAVTLIDDAGPGEPYVSIVSVTPEGSPMAWGDDQELSLWNVGLNCNASDATGALTYGVNPSSADAVLSDAVWKNLSHFEAMETAGFVNSNVVPGVTEMTGIDFKHPMTLTFEVYTSLI